MKISIITVCFNNEKTILDTLNSVLNQTYKGKIDNMPYKIIDIIPISLLIVYF